MRITLEQLRAAGVCREELDLFASLNGHKTELTESFVLEHGDKFDWRWYARTLLSPDGLAKYKRAVAAANAKYERAEQSAWVKYDRAKDAAGDEYERASTRSAWAKYMRAVESAEAEHKHAIYAAEARYWRALGLAFFRLYEKESTGR